MAAFDSGNIFELIDKMRDNIDNEYQKFTTLNIVVAGKTGVGKSTLINSVFSEKLAKTSCDLRYAGLGIEGRTFNAGTVGRYSRTDPVRNENRRCKRSDSRRLVLHQYGFWAH